MKHFQITYNQKLNMYLFFLDQYIIPNIIFWNAVPLKSSGIAEA